MELGYGAAMTQCNDSMKWMMKKEIIWFDEWMTEAIEWINEFHSLIWFNNDEWTQQMAPAARSATIRIIDSVIAQSVN